MNCLYRANICAGTAIGAYVRVNFIDITFRYCFNRTLIYACSASCAIIINFVSHFYSILVNYIINRTNIF